MNKVDIAAYTNFSGRNSNVGKLYQTSSSRTSYGERCFDERHVLQKLHLKVPGKKKDDLLKVNDVEFARFLEENGTEKLVSNIGPGSIVEDGTGQKYIRWITRKEVVEEDNFVA